MAKTKRAKARALKRRRAAAKGAAAATGAVPKSGKRIGDEELKEVLRLEHAKEHPKLAKSEKCGYNERNAPRRRFGEPTKIEYRTGSGVTVKEVSGGRGFGGTPGVIRQSAGCCNPAIHHCMDRFYGQIDRDLDEWQFREDLKLKVPYAVKAWRHHKRHMSLLRRDAKRRGVA